MGAILIQTTTDIVHPKLAQILRAKAHQTVLMSDTNAKYGVPSLSIFLLNLSVGVLLTFDYSQNSGKFLTWLPQSITLTPRGVKDSLF